MKYQIQIKVTVETEYSLLIDTNSKRMAQSIAEDYVQGKNISSNGVFEVQNKSTVRRVEFLECTSFRETRRDMSY